MAPSSRSPSLGHRPRLAVSGSKSGSAQPQEGTGARGTARARGRLSVSTLPVRSQCECFIVNHKVDVGHRRCAHSSGERSEPQRGHCRQRVRAQPLCSPSASRCTPSKMAALSKDWRLEHWQPRNQRPQRPPARPLRDLCCDTIDVSRLAQLLAAPHPQLEAQCCCRLVLSCAAKALASASIAHGWRC